MTERLGSAAIDEELILADFTANASEQGEKGSSPADTYARVPKGVPLVVRNLVGNMAETGSVDGSETYTLRVDEAAASSFATITRKHSVTFGIAGESSNYDIGLVPQDEYIRIWVDMTAGASGGTTMPLVSWITEV